MGMLVYVGQNDSYSGNTIFIPKAFLDIAGSFGISSLSGVVDSSNILNGSYSVSMNFQVTFGACILKRYNISDSICLIRVYGLSY